MHRNHLQSCAKHDVPKVVTRLVAKKRDLTKWWASLPADAMEPDVQDTRQARSAMHIRLEYCLVRMFVGRPFLLQKGTSHSGASPAPATPEDACQLGSEGAARQPMTAREDLVNECIQAAIEALGICQDLRDSGVGLARASYIEYSSCRASLLVLIASSIRKMSGKFRRPMSEGLSMIRDMSAAGESARTEVALIQSLERAVARLHAGGRRTPSDTGDGSTESGYDAFRSWGANLAQWSVADGAPSPVELLPMHVGGTSGSPWQPTQLDFQPPPLGADASSTVVGGYDPLVEMSFFENQASQFAAWSTYTEAQVLEHFISDTT